MALKVDICQIVEEDLREMSSSILCILSSLTYYTQQTFFKRERERERERERGIYLTDWLIKFGPNFAQCSPSSHHPPSFIFKMMQLNHMTSSVLHYSGEIRRFLFIFYILETQFVNVRCLLSSEYKLYIGTCLWEGSMPERKINLTPLLEAGTLNCWIIFCFFE